MRPAGWVVFLVATAGIIACTKSPVREQRAGPDPAAAASEIKVQVVHARPLEDYLELPGQIQPDPTRVVRVYAPVGGRLVAFQVRPGDHVRAGQTLAVLESGDVAAARADYAKAAADAQLKEEAYRRVADLYAHHAVALKDEQQAQADLAMSRAELQSAGERLRVLGVAAQGNSNDLPVVAPRAGVVVDVSAAAGEFSKSLDSSAPLCTLADLSTVWAVGDLYEKDLARARVGDPVEVRVNAYPDRKWSGRVNQISDTVDPTTRALKLRVVLANPGEFLRPQMFATIRLLQSQHVGLAAPSTAVVREGDSAYIFVVPAPGRYERRTVALGPSLGAQEVEIVSGLKDGDAVVVDGALLVRSTLGP